MSYSKLVDQLPDKPTEQEQYLHLINLMPEKVTKSDAEGNIFYFNQSWVDFTGESKEELVQEGWSNWIHPEDVEETESAWLEAIKSDELFEMEFRVRDQLGEYFWHMSRARPIQDKNGMTIQWICITTIIQDQKEENEQLEKVIKRRTKKLDKTIKELKLINLELTDTKEKLESDYARSLIEASLDPLITISTEGKITDMNEALTTITGKSRESLHNTDFENYFTEPKKARQIYQEVFKKGFIKNFPLVLVDGELVDVLFNGATYKNPSGKVLGAVVVARIVTEQNRIQKELLTAKETAESERKSAESAKLKAEAAVKSKEQFLSNMSHEIRTPLNAIIGFTDLLLKTELSEKQDKYMSAIKTSGNTLLLLINDILDLAKVNAGQMKFDQSPFDFAKTIEDVTLLFEEKVQAKGLGFELEFDSKIPEVLLGDSLRLIQIIVNLISNAIKFTDKGKITLSIKLIQQTNTSVGIEIAVKDTGIGIAEDRVNSIFESFQQASNDISKQYGGTGLGLTIAKQLVEGQGGSIKVISKLGKGSVFSFRLTFQKTDLSIKKEETLQEIDLNTKKIRVLVAEDFVLNQLLIKAILEGIGFEWEIAGNGKIAIEKLEAQHFDIVLMDLQMPVMDGYEATKHIRSVMNSNIPIIALTADVTTMDRVKCSVLGMDDYLAKPFDEKDLFNKIRKLTDPIPKRERLTGKKTQISKMNDINDRLTHFEYLDRITSSDQELMREVIVMYLDESPKYLGEIIENLKNEDWKGLYHVAHKIIPSFSVVGVSPEYIAIALDIQKFSNNESKRYKIPALVQELEGLIHRIIEELTESIRNETILVHEY